METVVKEKSKLEYGTPRIERGMIKTIIPYENGEVAFVHPSYKGDYISVGKQILENGLRISTGEEVATLLYTAYCIPEVHDEKEFENVRDIIKNRWLWNFNRNLWTENGVYVISDPRVLGLSKLLNVNQLEKSLEGGRELSWGGIRFSTDGSVRYAPKGSYVLGDHTSESLAKDGQVVASHGEIGAEKLGEVSIKFRNNPRTWGINVSEGQTPELRVSALIGYFCGRLGVGGRSFGDGEGNCGFGV
ncbi:hypothetical protein COU57_02420 [Candidatus Pacearchaeota archaeon CG10_big_fil_rev_8_21_14_0_10_32_14]|nr:MAG: hypothetical protein COU57_02420 [Candidatus Pacearchaeota archaeon CG10_big_fil_rev_8_21_14_0_10_32_14]